MPPDTRVDVTANGETAPTVIGQDFDGNEVRIENDGRAKAIVLLAHWCAHCQNEVPAVQAWLDSGGGVEGVDMYSVATAMDSNRDNFPPSEWLDREGWTVPVIRDDSNNSVHTAYGSGGFPFWVFVNSDGTVAFRARRSHDDRGTRVDHERTHLAQRTMEFGLMVEPQVGGSYAELRDLARWAEDQGLDAFARSDHFLNQERLGPVHRCPDDVRRPR